MRTELEGIFNDNTLLADLDDALPSGSKRELSTANQRRIVIIVTKEAHCLGDLYSINFKMHPPTQQKTRIVSPFLGLAVHLEVY